jgi:multidrug resistance efflux pump
MRRALILLAALLAAGCSGKPSQSASPRDGAIPASATAVAKGVVDAEGGLVSVRAPRDGVIVRLAAEVGDHVAAGQPLAVLDARQAGLALGATAAELADRRTQVQVATARAQGAEREAGRLARLAAQDAATRQDAEQAATAAAVARGEQRQAEDGLHVAEAKRRLDAYEVDVRTVRAPVPGKIVRRDAATGGFVSASGPLFLLAPDGRRVVRAELDEAFADRVRPGATATVSPEFRAGRGYPAHVLRVSDVLSAASLGEDADAKTDTRVVSVLLALDGAPELRIGQRVLVRFAP